MVFDFIVSFIGMLIAVFVVCWYDDRIRKKDWKVEKDRCYSLLYDAYVEIEKLCGCETELTEEIKDVLKF